MSKTSNLVLSLLNEISKGDFRLTYESMNILLEYLEDKNDPSNSEMEIVDAAYQFAEKYKILEAALRKYMKEKNQSALGNKVESLYKDYSKTL